MAITVSKTNTKIMRQPGGWVKAIHDTGKADADGKPVVVTATMSQAAIEVSAGVLLPKARVKAIVEAALNADSGADVELTAL